MRGERLAGGEPRARGRRRIFTWSGGGCYSVGGQTAGQASSLVELVVTAQPYQMAGKVIETSSPWTQAMAQHADRVLSAAQRKAEQSPSDLI